MSDNMYTDEIGRCYCEKHRREKCHQCCYDFESMNRQTEIDEGLRKPPSEVETLTEQRGMLIRGIKFMQDNRQPENDPNMVFHRTELARIEKRLKELQLVGKSNEISEAMRATDLKNRAHDVEMAAVLEAWSKQNPGKTSMEFGGDDHQKIYDKVASLPPSAGIDQVDLRTCGYCGKSSSEKILVCSRCRAVAYCNRECQKAAWKGHKKFCKEKLDGEDKRKKKLPLTWEQLEAFGGLPAEGEVLEVRVMSVMAITRQVIECKDRVGVVRTIAAYNDYGAFPGVAAGKILRWEDPRFHYFIDGNCGARIEEEDMVNVTISDV